MQNYFGRSLLAGKRIGLPRLLRAVSLSFSLIELLVVISIVATLFALLMPALKTAKESAQQAACMNNLRQIGLAMDIYGDERRFYPWGYEGTTDWSYTIQPYLQKASGLGYGVTQHNARSTILQCPSRTYKPTNVVSTYGCHDRLLGNKFGPPNNTTPPYPRVFPHMERPSDIWVIADADQNPSNLGGEALATLWNIDPEIQQNFDSATGDNLVANVGDNTDDPGSLGQIRWRHKFNSRANFVFIDGHVESIEKGKMKERQLKFTGP
jgi:prepilin-type processing-associated H-X9-DG protein